MSRPTPFPLSGRPVGASVPLRSAEQTESRPAARAARGRRCCRPRAPRGSIQAPDGCAQHALTVFAPSGVARGGHAYRIGQSAVGRPRIPWDACFADGSASRRRAAEVRPTDRGFSISFLVAQSSRAGDFTLADCVCDAVPTTRRCGSRGAVSVAASARSEPRDNRGLATRLGPVAPPLMMGPTARSMSCSEGPLAESAPPQCAGRPPAWISRVWRRGGRSASSPRECRSPRRRGQAARSGRPGRAATAPR
jgi:hypothetical protein